MPPARTQAEYESQQYREKLATSYQSLLNQFSSQDLLSVGNYTLGRLIGKGSFGKVYLASHTLTNGSKVVLKSAKKDDSNLAREIHHHRQFLHPHIARLYEVIVTENLVWLVLEYCPGDELYNHLLNNGRMEPAKVQRIFTQLVGAVSYVHGKSCVHRDLKLENILLDKHENVKLVDFGFTREYQGSTSYLQTWCGTVCYSAPEMLKGEKYAGEKVDVWSLGIILYALLCGELPYDDDDESATKARILKEDPIYPDHIPEPAQDLIKKLLSKRPLLRPSLADILRDPWLAEHAPQQQEILKLQQPAPFSTQLEKDVLQRMRSAGVDIDMVIERVLSQRCDSLAGWWALLLEKEQRKERRRERKRKEREAEAKSIRRLSAASNRLLRQSSLGEIYEGEEHVILETPRSRGRRLSRTNGNAVQVPELPKVTESKSPDLGVSSSLSTTSAQQRRSRSRSRPVPPPKDHPSTAIRRTTNASRNSRIILHNVASNPNLLSPSYVPPPQRKRKTFYAQPLKEQLAWVRHLFKDGSIKRNKSPAAHEEGKKTSSPKSQANTKGVFEQTSIRDFQRSATSPIPPVPQNRPELQTRSTLPVRPRLDTTSSTGSVTSVRAKRTSLSPNTLTPHSSFHRRSSGLRGRKSTSSSVSSIRSTYQAGHQHTHSKASSTSSTSIASPSRLSSASGTRLARSPRNSVILLPSTPTTGSLPSGIRVSRRPPSNISSLTTLTNQQASTFSMPPPPSPGLPVFARKKRSVFKGPVGGSPAGFNRTPMASASSTRSPSAQGRPSTEMMPGVEEEDEDAAEEADIDYEDVDHFGPELNISSANTPDPGADEAVIDTTPTAVLDDATPPLSPLMLDDTDPLASPTMDATAVAAAAAAAGAGPMSTPLTAAALAKMEQQQQREKEVQETSKKSSNESPPPHEVEAETTAHPSP